MSLMVVLAVPSGVLVSVPPEGAFATCTTRIGTTGSMVSASQ